MIGVSACLAGCYCRYDGNHNLIDSIKELVDKGQALTICPEVLGGMPIPRKPAEIIGGDGFDVWKGQAIVKNNAGEDVTEAFKTGTLKAYEKLQSLGIKTMIMKERSPSCGSKMIYDGTFSGTRKVGVGVATAYFLTQGIEVYSEEEWLEKDGFDGN